MLHKAQIRQVKALSVEEAQNVVVRADEQDHRIPVRLVLSKHARVYMAMGRNQGQPGYKLVKLPGGTAQPWVSGEEPVRMREALRHYGLAGSHAPAK